MSDMSAPVAATSRAGVKINCRNGAANTPVLAPTANECVNQATPAHRAMPRTKAGGQMTAKPPAKVSTLRPPRSRAKTGQACPIMAAATAAYTRATPPGGPATQDRGHQDPVLQKPVCQHQAEETSRGALQRVPGQHRESTRPPQLVLHVPEARVLVPDLARVDPPRAAGQHRDRNRAQEVAAGHGSHPGVKHDRLFSPHQIPA